MGRGRSGIGSGAREAQMAEKKPAAGGPPAPMKKNVTRIERYTEIVDPEQKTVKEKQEIDEDAANNDAWEDPEADADSLEAALAEFDEGRAGLILRVDRLKIYSQNGKAHSTAPKEFCDEFAYSPDYLSIIRAQFGPGTYLLRLKDSFHRFLKQKIITIAAMQPAQMGAAGGQPPIHQPPIHVIPPPPPAPAPVSLTDQLEEIARIIDLVKRISPPPLPAAVPEAPADERPVADRILESIALKAVENDDGSRLDRILDAIAGKRESGILERIAEALAPFIPQIVDGLRMAARRALPGPPGQPGLAGQPGQLPAPPGTPGIGGDAESAPGGAELAWRRVIRRLTEDCLEAADPTAALASLDDLITRYPGLEPTVARLATLDAAELMQMIALVEPGEITWPPHAVDWLRNLQQELRQDAGAGAEAD